jgi:hypothetical protein
MNRRVASSTTASGARQRRSLTAEPHGRSSGNSHPNGANGPWIDPRGTHNGPLDLPSGTLPATGKAVEFDGVQMFIVEGGKLTHMRHYLDLLTMLSQVGAIPA